MGQEVAKQVQPKANILDSSNSTTYAPLPKHLYKKMSPLNRCEYHEFWHDNSLILHAWKAYVGTLFSASLILDWWSMEHIERKGVQNLP